MRGLLTGMRRLVALGWLALSALIALSACGSSNPEAAASAGAAGTGSNTGGTGIGVATGGQTNGAASGGTTLGFGGTGNSSGGSGSIDACAETAQMGKLVPLDIYIMLDVSGSMLDATTAAANAPTKWSAVRSALQAFLTDPGSDGLGVGIQYFPLADPAVPATCNSDAQCGAAHGPCFLKFCQNAGPGYFPCSAAAEC
ncbi:MAG: hypothetical protein ACXW2I_20900, partial [Burkholderiales bacterium]